VLCVGAAVAIAVLDTQLAGLLLPEAYREHAVALLPSIVFGAVMISLKFFVFDNAFYTAKRNDLYLISMAIPAVVGAVTSVAMISRWGIDGAGLSFVVTTTLSTFSSFLLSRRVLPFRLPVGRIALVLTAAAIAGGVLMAVETMLQAGSPFVQLAAGGTVFGVVYAAFLMAFGFSIRSVLLTPWAQGGDEPEEAADMPAIRPAGGRA
jgi:O-antigen/teichoic acid export membrane protein